MLGVLTQVRLQKCPAAAAPAPAPHLWRHNYLRDARRLLSWTEQLHKVPIGHLAMREAWWYDDIFLNSREPIFRDRSIIVLHKALQ